MPSELPSALVEPVPVAQLAPPGQALAAFPAPVPNYQDLSESESEGPDKDDDDRDWEAIVAAAEAAFTEDEIAEMQDYLRERGLFAFLREYLERRSVAPHTLLLAFGVMVRPESSLMDQLRMLKIACARVLRNREKLAEYSSPQDVVELLRTKKRILILTGAGVSTSCGIPDFRSPTGLYARLKLDSRFATLDDPQDMFDLSFFRSDPSVFYSFAKEIYPSQFRPSECHRFVRLLELKDKLLRNYTQNIDGLFEQVGVERMLNCHGSFATASCLICKRRFPGSSIESDVFASRVPLCPHCTPLLEAEELEREREREQRREERERSRKRRKVKEGEWDPDAEDDEEEDGAGGIDGMDERNEWEGKAVIKPDIVFFGEALSDEFDHRLLEDREQVDLLIVMGTSLRVSPVAQLPSHLPHSIPQILINRDPVAHHNFDVCLLGDGDTVVKWLCDELAKTEVERDQGETWDLDKEVPVSAKPATNGNASPADEEKPDIVAASATNGSTAISTEPEQVGHSHVWLFPGANRESRWVESVRHAYGSDAEDEDSENEDEDSDNEDEDEDEDDNKDKDKKSEAERADKPVELPASLAPGVIEGEGSDGPDSVSGEEDDAPNVGETRVEAVDDGAMPVAAANADELQRIAPSFLHSAGDLA